ncbi:MAG: histidine--tRNA ligase [Deltaproteobacteria bacterium]|nr:histidine--tRNA ligase [Deltaproteobacteria bacterium]MBU53826.1 histidine--tRNA ligase [Deltaproteobacteria bacterium]
MKPSIPKGTRDFGPEEVNKRNYIFDTVKSVFVRYGFHPIETPAMENLTTLTGKYGEEGDQLLFKVLNNGDYLRKADKDALAALDSSQLTASISKRGLRYDLTVPFARFVVQHQNDLTFPFKRYQIQPVWRADRPQKGRYQEFYQCDVDVIGSDSLLYEAELVQIYDEVFKALGLKVKIRLNHRKILEGLADICGISDKLTDLTITIDKLDKFKNGWQGACEELSKRGITEDKHAQIKQVLDVTSLDQLKDLYASSEVGQAGLAEMEKVHAFLEGYDLHNTLAFDVTLARGLSYYTGCIFEVVVDTDVEGQEKVKMGSIGGGGRYADLTGIFGLNDMSGVGVSFGAERIYDVMEELSLFPEETRSAIPKILFLAFDEASHMFAFKQVTALRQAGISADIYPEPTKFKKQMKYANARGFSHIGIIGEDERTAGKITLKNMQTSEQTLLSPEDLLKQLQD